MAGSLTLGGMADGLLIGQITVGPSTINGKENIGEVINATLEANVDFVVKVPAGAVAWACVFTFKGEAPGEVKVRTNLNNADTGMPIGTEGFAAQRLASGVTELKFKSASPPSIFQLTFI